MKERLAQASRPAEMTRIGLPVPACFHYNDGMLRLLLKHGVNIRRRSAQTVEEKSARLERVTRESATLKGPPLVERAVRSARPCRRMIILFLNLG